MKILIIKRNLEYYLAYQSPLIGPLWVGGWSVSPWLPWQQHLFQDKADTWVSLETLLNDIVELFASGSCHVVVILAHLTFERYITTDLLPLKEINII